ncbi:LOW QUALITY PROTEIN: proline-rich protein 36 [Drosophila eugracilis]|uniref:LOW QUALITY PROTEIN: proline-rich protein 36 n=1 Tax=Drosophila eugracilis TaxID=29029 RepID=UPI001BD9C971|nr:LOW QUALITY PROTEIN: proline-rich protein 36 [Drosophila eugracilis]
MSERSKGDVSARINNNANPTRVVKNPLLSASVTGLSFDDFPNKPQLLPAAPPVVHAALPPAPVLIAGILNREPKTLVTVGQPSSIDDSEALDEINLNTSSEDSIGVGGSSPYQGAGDPNANPLLEPPQEAGNDSLLSQAASSFTALPAVASNVFSTFSKRIYAGSRESSEEPKLDIQPTYIQQANYVQPVPPAPAPFYAAPPTAASEGVAPEPPKFYAPTEIPAPSVGVPGPPPAAGNPNTYRFTARKKLYAPIPGFSEQSGPAAQIQQAPPAVPSFQTPPYPPQPAPAANSAPFDISAHPAPAPTEERKSGGGLFSLTSLVPTGVLQNITGLVQSATGRSSEPGYNNPQQPGGYLDSSTGAPAPAPSTNLFGGLNPPVPSGGNYFVPGAAPSLPQTEVVAPTAVGSFFAPPAVLPAPSSGNVAEGIFKPTAAPPPVGGFFSPAPTPIVPAVSPSVFNPEAVPPGAPQSVPTVSTSAVPPANLPPASTAGGFFSPAPTPIAPGVPPSIFTPAAVPPVVPQVVPPENLPPTPAIGGFFTSETTTSVPEALPPSNLPPTSGIGVFFNPGVVQPDATTAQTPFSLPVTTPAVPPAGFFPPATLPTVQTASNPNPLPGAPPVAAVPPPAAGQSSYRLQKGTRLYKSPLTAQETAVSSGFAAPLPPTSAPAAIFNPFGAPASGSFNPVAQLEPQSNQGVPFFTPPVGNSSGQISQLNQGYSAPPLEALVQGAPLKQDNPLFGPTSSDSPFFVPQATKEAPSGPSGSEQLVENQTPNQGIQFFAPPPSAPAGINLFTTPIYQEPIQAKEEPKQSNIQEESITTPIEAALFAPPVIEPVLEEKPPTSSEVSAAQVVSTSEVDQGENIYSAPSAPVEQEVPLFVPVPALSGQSPGIPLYPPPPTAAPPATSTAAQFVAEPAPSSVSSFFSPAGEDSAASLFAPPTTSTLFAPIPTTQSPPDLIPATSDQLAVEAPPAFLGTPETTSTNLFQSTNDTQTVFSPFSQTKATPLIQETGTELVPPPIGFFAKQVETEAPSQPPLAPSPLQSFFNPAASSDFNFFANPAPGSVFPELPIQQGIAPPPLALEPPSEAATKSIASAPLGFELLSQSQQAQEQTQSSIENSYPNSSVNSFTGYFGGPAAPPLPSVASEPTEAPVAPVINCDPVNFFDQVPESQSQIQQANEDQRIQNFFNNPPLQDQPAAPGELKYDIVHSGVAVKQLQERSQTPVSNLVEPPSSACSEFSTLAPAPTPSQSGEDLLQQHLGELPEEVLRELRMASASNDKGQVATPPVAITYSPVVAHWFYKRSVDTKFIWTPFSHYDSALLETSLQLDDSTLIIPVEGGRYDVNIKERTKTPVYWEGKAIEVRRCSWFYKGVDSKYVPYTEDTAALLEAEYKRSAETGEWHQKIMLANGEQVVFHGPTVIVHFLPQQNGDTWGASTQGSMRPRVVKRDLDDFTIEQGESQRVDHLLFMVHGIGSACDLKMRSVEEVVDDFRVIAQQLVQSHYKNSTDMGLVGRVEVLPISWHGHLHSEELGIDEKLKSITLESIPRLRNFTNDTLLDVLFYTSPKYCQKIMNTVADALNDVYLKYRMRHPEFNGGVSLAGHSLGSLILFDLLCHQEPLKESEEENKENPDQLPQKQAPQKVQLPTSDLLPKQVSYAMGPEGTGQPVITYTQLIFHPKKFFALGSPIGMFVTIRGIDKLGLDFHLPTCSGFYNIFHPFDPVAYRIEALVNPDMNGIRPVLIPHHKGRKRMHLELKETMTRVGADIKQRFMDTFKTTLDSVNFLATVTKVKKEAEESLEKETSQTSSQALQKQSEDQDESSVASSSCKLRNRTDSNSTTASDPEFVELDFPLGKLNDSKRVDYVLQEAPLEFINEYIFALSSHVCYWGSEDTILFVMKEIYASLGISTDSQVPQSSMTIERPVSHESSVSQSLLPM